MLKIAMVGAHRPGTFDDQMRLFSTQMHGWIADDINPKNLDVINLEYGRDFLNERRRYSTVIVHSVFHSNRSTFKPIPQHERRGSVNQSPRHSIEAWRRRLAGTCAETIVVWELVPCTLNGWQLNELNGYRIAHRDHRVTVYKRKA